MPKFLFGKYNPPVAAFHSSDFEKMLCSVSNTSIDYCIKDTSLQSSQIYLLVFSLAQIILGIGATPLLTLGVSYIDENVNPKHSPVYMGIIYAATFVGTTAGLIVTGFFLKTFVETDLVSIK